jgi:membrane-bound inhibitor of C-type lysozyme
MRKYPAILLCALATLACLSGCGSAKQEQLAVQGGEPITYQCEGGEQIVARYYSLSDKSLHFVKVTMPDGQEHTLPNVLSASGARYTDDYLWVWWTKGESAFAEARDQDGEWQVKYQNCQQVTK